MPNNPNYNTNQSEKLSATERVLRQGYAKFPYHIAREMSPMAAVVYGEILRYSKGYRGVCQASFQTIGRNIGMSDDTVSKYVKQLHAAGYIIDRKVNLRHRPHTIEVTNLLIERDGIFRKFAEQDTEGEGEEYNGIIEIASPETVEEEQDSPEISVGSPEISDSLYPENSGSTISQELRDKDLEDYIKTENKDLSVSLKEPITGNTAMGNEPSAELTDLEQRAIKVWGEEVGRKMIEHSRRMPIALKPSSVEKILSKHFGAGAKEIVTSFDEMPAPPMNGA